MKSIIRKAILDVAFISMGAIGAFFVFKYIKSSSDTDSTKLDSIENKDMGQEDPRGLSQEEIDAYKEYSDKIREDGVLSLPSLRKIDFDAYLETFAKFQEDLRQELLESCLEPLKKRISELKSKPVPMPDKRYFWFMVVSIKSKNGVGQAGFVKLDTGSEWPPYFDEEAKQCYIQSISSKKYNTTRDYEYSCSIPFCLSPSRLKDLNPVDR